MPCPHVSVAGNAAPSTARFHAGARGFILDKGKHSMFMTCQTAHSSLASNRISQQLGFLGIFPKKVRRRIFDFLLLPVDNIDVNRVKKDANITGPVAIIIHSNPNMGLHSVSWRFTREVAPVSKSRYDTSASANMNQSVKLCFYIQIIRDVHFRQACYCTDAFYTAHLTMEGYVFCLGTRSTCSTRFCCSGALLTLQQSQQH